VPQARLERALLSEQDFESSASTNSTTGATEDASRDSVWMMQLSIARHPELVSG
jgi:hypothetical protein